MIASKLQEHLQKKNKWKAVENTIQSQAKKETSKGKTAGKGNKDKQLED